MFIAKGGLFRIDYDLDRVTLLLRTIISPIHVLYAISPLISCTNSSTLRSNWHKEGFVMCAKLTSVLRTSSILIISIVIFNLNFEMMVYFCSMRTKCSISLALTITAQSGSTGLLAESCTNTFYPVLKLLLILP